MSFTDDIYRYRTNRSAFVQGLLKRVDSEWKKVTAVGHSYVLPGGMARKTTAPVYLDKQRVKALLKAWLRQLPPAQDRYLDLATVRRFEWRQFADTDDALSVMRKNASAGGAVRFIRDDLESSGTGQRGSTVFFGPKLFKNWSYDTYFSYLLSWDDTYCFGLIRELQMKEIRTSLGGGGAVHPAWRAARQWVIANKQNGVYKFYNIQIS